MQKNILILGGSRFIGYLMVSELIKKGHNVTVFNRQISIPPAPFPKTTKFIKGNRDSSKDLEYLFYQEYDAIIDFSGHTYNHVDLIIRKYSSKIGQYIFISTVGVYKEPCPNPITEESSLNIINKIMAENLLIDLKEKLPVTIFRPIGVFGPYDPCLAGLIFYRIINTFPILIGKNSNVKVTHLYVFDLIRALTLSINNPKTFGKIFNIAGDDKLNLIEFINLCGKICSIYPIIKHEEIVTKYNKIDFINKKRHVDFFTEWPKFNMICSNALVKKELKIEFTSLEKSLYKTYLWLIADKIRLNYFSLRGERYILNNQSVPFYQKGFWKTIDCSNSFINKFKQILKSVNLLRKIHQHFKSIMATRTKS